MKRTDLAYTAGIVDGEGCIGIYTKGKGKGRGIPNVAVAIDNTNEWLCQWIKFSYGGSIHRIDRYAERNHKPSWKWTISGKQALIFLQLIFPYLRLKKPQAEVAIQFLKARRGRGYPSTEGELAIAEAQRIVMHKLNKKGVHSSNVL